MDLETEKANLLSKTPKLITEQLKWKSEPGDRYRINVKVLAPDINEVLSLRRVVGKTNYSFCLLYKNFPDPNFLC